MFLSSSDIGHSVTRTFQCRATIKPVSVSNCGSLAVVWTHPPEPHKHNNASVVIITIVEYYQHANNGRHIRRVLIVSSFAIRPATSQLLGNNTNLI